MVIHSNIYKVMKKYRTVGLLTVIAYSSTQNWFTTTLLALTCVFHILFALFHAKFYPITHTALGSMGNRGSHPKTVVNLMMYVYACVWLIDHNLRMAPFYAAAVVPQMIHIIRTSVSLERQIRKLRKWRKENPEATRDEYMAVLHAQSREYVSGL